MVPLIVTGVTDDLVSKVAYVLLNYARLLSRLSCRRGVTMTCTYSGSLSSAAAENRATATYADKSVTAVAPITWANATMTETDTCADVDDSLAGALGEVCAGTETSFNFEYPLTVGPYDVCGDYTVDNTATVTEVDSGDTDYG